MIIYRTEIDGLRAIAVLAVILYHAGFIRLVPGGYVGVDVFFVISGYLITLWIESEKMTKTFSLIYFYERRCRRILPALFVMLIFNCIFAYFYMLSNQLKVFGQSLITVLFFSSNIFFWWKDDGYFARLTELNPLVHTWSLSVEEQFYIIFPLCYYMLSQNRFQLRIIFIVCSLISFFLAQFGRNFLRTGSTEKFHLFSPHPCASFYLPIGRIWELLIGTFAAYYLQSNSYEKYHRKFHEFFSVIGLVLILIAIVFFDHRIIPPFPNAFTLVPTVGTLLVILFGTRETWIGRLLSTTVLRWIGLISYSAYLWHQPILVFLRLRSPTAPSTFSVIVALVVIFLLAILSYSIIETPFRNRNYLTSKQIFGTALSSALILFIIALVFIRVGNVRSFNADEFDDSYVAEGMAKMNQKSKTFSDQSSGDTSTRKILLIGDSFAQDFYNMIFENRYLINDEILAHFIHRRCQLQIDPENRFDSMMKQRQQKCMNTADILSALPLIRQADIIIFAIRWDVWSAGRLPSIIELLRIRKDQQLFIIGVKNFGRINPNVYLSKAKTIQIPERQYPEPEAIEVNSLLKKNIDPSMFVNIQELICGALNGSCPLVTPDGQLISDDGNHLTRSGARYIGQILFSSAPLSHLLSEKNKENIQS